MAGRGAHPFFKFLFIHNLGTSCCARVCPKVLTTIKNNILTITSFPFHKETIVKLSCFPGIPLYLHFHFVPIKDRVRDFSPIEGVLMPIVERG